MLLQEKGEWENGHVPGLRRVPGMVHQVRVLGFMQERMQEQAKEKQKQVYSEVHTP